MLFKILTKEGYMTVINSHSYKYENLDLAIPRYIIFHCAAAFMLTASFHSGCRQGSLVGAAISLAAKEVYAQLDHLPPVSPSMTLGQLSFR